MIVPGSAAVVMTCVLSLACSEKALKKEPQTDPTVVHLGSRGRKADSVAEGLVRERVEAWAEAIRAKDVERVTSFYAPEIESFDLGPPLRYEGIDRKRRAWQELFARYAGPMGYEVHGLTVTTNGALAFARSVNHVSGTLVNGRSSNLWVRWTACLERIDNVWLVTHDHVSIPADLEQGRAVMNLTP